MIGRIIVYLFTIPLRMAFTVFIIIRTSYELWESIIFNYHLPSLETLLLELKNIWTIN